MVSHILAATLQRKKKPICSSSLTSLTGLCSGSATQCQAAACSFYKLACRDLQPVLAQLRAALSSRTSRQKSGLTRALGTLSSEKKEAEHGSGLGLNSWKDATGTLENCTEEELPQTNSGYSSCTSPPGQKLPRAAPTCMTPAWNSLPC